jgi:hypothetical protein
MPKIIHGLRLRLWVVSRAKTSTELGRSPIQAVDGVSVGACPSSGRVLRLRRQGEMASVAEQFWREILDMRCSLEPIARHRPRPQRLVLVKGGSIRREARGVR